MFFVEFFRSFYTSVTVPSICQPNTVLLSSIALVYHASRLVATWVTLLTTALEVQCHCRANP